MTSARAISTWLLLPIHDPARPLQILNEQPTGANLLERIRTQAEIKAIGRARFAGTLKQKNALWLDDRNFLRQAISNFRVALTVDNRSASLLYYYAMLNFAKAELLGTHASAVHGFVGHGLRFHVTNARTIAGDSLVVGTGVFPLLYELRTGYALPSGTRLPIARLLQRIPEIGEQLGTLGRAETAITGLIQMVAMDSGSVWVLLASSSAGEFEENTASGRYFRRHFRKVDPPPNWRDQFAISRRAGLGHFYESLGTFPYVGTNTPSQNDAVALALAHTWALHDILGRTTSGSWDAWVAPSLYRSRMLPMPPSLARYAIAFYASSLVRYRPSMFDTQVHPDHAYLFDAIARECAVPMLIDTLSEITGADCLFLADDALRL